MFGITARPRAVIIGAGYKLKTVNAAFPVSNLQGNLAAAIGEMATSIDESSLVSDFTLNQNYPNPFNPTTTISYSLEEGRRVNLSVFNSLGEMVSELVNKDQDKGEYSVSFDGSNLNSGVYFYKLTVDGTSSIKKMILTK
ncbi:MAG: hypothetical protein CR982_04895 [Candidatus Cloacimonadota bacterium]|nr:MAG: hypothetical protein CR982_04895 [Candidatus Cloacimonadota bacterium]PIE77370.1 MAG: hypothetical protein CSA15_13290 [Candidatus Delongbacteria bacterium]